MGISIFGKDETRLEVPISEMNGVSKYLQTDPIDNAFDGDQSIYVNAAISMNEDAYVKELQYRLCVGQEKHHTVPPPGYDKFCSEYVPQHILRQICNGDRAPSTGAPGDLDCNEGALK